MCLNFQVILDHFGASAAKKQHKTTTALISSHTFSTTVHLTKSKSPKSTHKDAAVSWRAGGWVHVFEVETGRGICDRALCDTAEHHSGPTLRKQGHNLMNNKHTAKAICQNAAAVGEPRAEGQTLDGQTRCQTLLSPERNIRSNTAHKKDFFLGAVRWQFAFLSPTWCHSSAVICHSPCARVRSLFAQMGCQRSVARWITLHVKPHRRRGSFSRWDAYFFGGL